MQLEDAQATPFAQQINNTKTILFKKNHNYNKKEWSFSCIYVQPDIYAIYYMSMRLSS